MILPILAAMVSGCGSARAEIAGDWTFFKSNFVMADGRVVDSPGSTSHARSQGIALLGAVAADDRDEFNHILRWTEANLDVRGDGLFACEWLPEAGVTSKRDSADGDILIAWALLRAQARWHSADLSEKARRNVAGIRKRLIREHGGYLLLLPSAEGYDGRRTTTVNLSYWIYPAFKDFNGIDPTPLWRQLAADGLRILEQARFGAAKLPSDWIDIDEHGAVVPSAGQPPRFGRGSQLIPLFLAWGMPGEPRLADLEEPFLKRWAHETGAIAPLWIDVATGTIAPNRAGPGLDAVLAVVHASLEKIRPAIPPMAAGLDFPAASVILLGEISAAPSH